MFPDLHAIVVLGTILLPLIAIALSPGWPSKQEVRLAMLSALPFAAVGLICLLALSAMGVPIAEWVFPMLGAVLVALFARNKRASQAVRWSLFALSAVLTVNSFYLRADDFTSDADRACAIFRQKEQVGLLAVQQELQKQPADRILAEGPISSPAFDCRTLESRWYTPFTGLYKIRHTPSVPWYPGGPVGTGAKQLEWRPADNS